MKTGQENDRCPLSVFNFSVSLAFSWRVRGSVSPPPSRDAHRHHCRHHGDDLLHLLVVRWISGFPGRSQAPPETVERLRALYGFDQPLYIQFGRYVARLGRGDLGCRSRPPAGPPDILTYFRHPRVGDLRHPPGIVSASLWACCPRVPEPTHRPVLQGAQPVGSPRRSSGWVGLMLIFIQARWLPTGAPRHHADRAASRQRRPPDRQRRRRDWRFRDAIKHLIMPAASSAWSAWRGSRGSLVQHAGGAVAEYVKTARIKG